MWPSFGHSTLLTCPLAPSGRGGVWSSCVGGVESPKPYCSGKQALWAAQGCQEVPQRYPNPWAPHPPPASPLSPFFISFPTLYRLSTHPHDPVGKGLQRYGGLATLTCLLGHCVHVPCGSVAAWGEGRESQSPEDPRWSQTGQESGEGQGPCREVWARCPHGQEPRSVLVAGSSRTHLPWESHLEREGAVCHWMS